MIEKYLEKVKLNSLDDRNGFTITIGFFDGIHKGHQYILRELRKHSFENNLYSAVISFDNEFLRLLKKTQSTLLTLEEKKKFLSFLGIDYLMILKFSQDIIKLKPKEFIRELLDNIDIKCICVGENFRFGKDKQGDVNTLKELGDLFGFKVRIFPLLKNNDTLSSSSIRGLLEKGKVDEAKEKLGYYYFIRSKVIEGDKIGRSIGFPTANIEVPNKIIPSNGIYRGKVMVNEKFYKTAVYIGNKPTFNNPKGRIIEAHILDYQGDDLVDKEIEVIFQEFIREERKFKNLDELKEQIAKDVDYVRSYSEKVKGIITIDGPAGSGKTTVAKLLAKTLDYDYLDSGALYRAVAYMKIKENLNSNEDLISYLGKSPFKFFWDGEEFKVFYKDKDISKIIRSDEIGRGASIVGTIKDVRDILTNMQREFYKENKGLVIEGRDSGTYVFPNANLKIYLTANLEVRAKRRATELNEDYKKILESIKERDLKDSTRAVAPLKIPDDAFIIDTSYLSPKDVVLEIISLYLKVL
ncbi:MAG: cytidylate kinase [Dictyoglomus sp. NZ13-RE01]|nr:MAG: cytidylate kinase [Dictyoglomus sp. NZ13-RE01]